MDNDTYTFDNCRTVSYLRHSEPVPTFSLVDGKTYCYGILCMFRPLFYTHWVNCYFHTAEKLYSLMINFKSSMLFQGHHTSTYMPNLVRVIFQWSFHKTARLFFGRSTFTRHFYWNFWIYLFWKQLQLKTSDFSKFAPWTEKQSRLKKFGLVFWESFMFRFRLFR